MFQNIKKTIKKIHEPFTTIENKNSIIEDTHGLMFKKIRNTIKKINEPFTTIIKKDKILEEKKGFIEDSKTKINEYDLKVKQFEYNFSLAEEEFEEYSRNEDDLTQEQFNMQDERNAIINNLREEKDTYIESQDKIIADLDKEYQLLISENEILLADLLTDCKKDKDYTANTVKMNSDKGELSGIGSDLISDQKAAISKIDGLTEEYAPDYKALEINEKEEEVLLKKKFDTRREEINEREEAEKIKYKEIYDILQKKIVVNNTKIKEKDDEILHFKEQKEEICNEGNKNNPKYIEKKEEKERKQSLLKKERTNLEERKLTLKYELENLELELEHKNLDFDLRLKINLDKLNNIKLKKQKFIDDIGEFNNLIGDMNIKLKMFDTELKNYNKLKLMVETIEKMNLEEADIGSTKLVWKFILSTFTAAEIKKWNLPDAENLDWDSLKESLEIVKTLNLHNIKNIMALRNKLKLSLTRGKNINIGNILSGKNLKVPKGPKIDLNPKDDKAKIAVEFEFRYSTVAIVIFSILILILLFIKITRS